MWFKYLSLANADATLEKIWGSKQEGLNPRCEITEGLNPRCEIIRNRRQLSWLRCTLPPEARMNHTYYHGQLGWESKPPLYQKHEFSLYRPIHQTAKTISERRIGMLGWSFCNLRRRGECWGIWWHRWCTWGIWAVRRRRGRWCVRHRMYSSA